MRAHGSANSSRRLLGVNNTTSVTIWAYMHCQLYHGLLARYAGEKTACLKGLFPVHRIDADTPVRNYLGC